MSTKGDGVKIRITFDQELVGDVSGSEFAFLVEVPEYNYVPGGTIEHSMRQVKSVSSEDATSIVLELYPGNTHSIQNAVEDVVVHYSGKGNLRGLGGPVAPFDWGFIGEDLIYKGHQNDIEHIEISNVVAEGNLIRIYYSDSKTDEHISITNIAVVGKLISVDDI